MQTFSAFISYASPDKDQAEEICASLENAGHTCWIAPRNVRPGKEYGEEIIRGIENSRCLVLVLSNAANESTFVRREVERAISKKKAVFPIRIEEVMPSPALELFVSTTHWIDAWRPPMAQHCETLAKGLESDSTFAALKTQSQRADKRRKLPRWIGSVAVVIAIVAGVALTNHFTRPPTETLDSEPHSVNPATPTFPSPDEQAEYVSNAIDSVYTQSFQQKTGRPIDSLTAEDFEVSLSDPNRKGEFGLNVTTSPEIKSALNSAEVWVGAGDSPLKSAGSFYGDRGVDSRYIDQELLQETGFVTIKFLFAATSLEIGPFEYEVSIADTMRLKMLTAALEMESPKSRAKSTEGALYLSYYDFWPVVKSIHFGWTSSDALQHHYELTPPEGNISGEMLTYAGFLQSKYPDRIPVPIGEKTAYVRFDLIDGKSTKVFEIDLDQRNFTGGKAGILVLPTKSPAGVDPLAIIVNANRQRGSYLNDEDGLIMIPIFPIGSSNPEYSFDDNGYFEIDKDLRDLPENNHLLVRINKPAVSSTLRLRYTDKHGETVGPFVYQLEPAPVIQLASKQAFLTARDDHLKAIYIRESDEGSKLNSLLNSEGLPWEEMANTLERPSFLFTPKNKKFNESPWAGITKVEMGIREDALEVVHQVSPDKIPPLFEGDDKARKEAYKAFTTWWATFPADTEAVFSRYTFYDGEQTRINRLPLPKKR